MTRRLGWRIYREGRVGVIVTDLDTELWAVASHRVEWIARWIALRRLDTSPSGVGRRLRRASDETSAVQALPGDAR